MTRALCPYCQKQLETMPKRKTKCPYCDHYIYVRQGKLLTENQVLEDAAKARLMAVFEMSAEKYDRTKATLTTKLGYEPATDDVVWHILNEYVATGQTESAYREMIRMLQQAGQDTTAVRESLRNTRTASLRNTLQQMKSAGVTHISYQTVNDDLVCSQCKTWSEGPIPIDTAIDQMPIPHSCNSELEFCRCWITAESPSSRTKSSHQQEADSKGKKSLFNRIFGRR